MRRNFLFTKKIFARSTQISPSNVNIVQIRNSKLQGGSRHELVLILLFRLYLFYAKKLIHILFVFSKKWTIDSEYRIFLIHGSSRRTCMCPNYAICKGQESFNCQNTETF